MFYLSGTLILLCYVSLLKNNTSILLSRSSLRYKVCLVLLLVTQQSLALAYTFFYIFYLFFYLVYCF
uniref:Uncharacterized protein n=1 Tax=Anguilla anguilla TaxID=7936 RepID=A0A0E9QP45_ANGAN